MKGWLLPSDLQAAVWVGRPHCPSRALVSLPKCSAPLRSGKEVLSVLLKTGMCLAQNLGSHIVYAPPQLSSGCGQGEALAPLDTDHWEVVVHILFSFGSIGVQGKH